MRWCGLNFGHTPSWLPHGGAGTLRPRYVENYPGNEGSMGPFSWGDQPLPSRWKMPSADWP
jgi:hypothetical protein